MATPSRSLRSRGLDLLATAVRLPLKVLETVVPAARMPAVSEYQGEARVFVRSRTYTESSAASSGYVGPAGKGAVEELTEKAHSAGARPDAEGFVPVTRVGALKPNSAMVVRPAGQAVALVMVGEEYRAVGNACPHSDGSLGDGDVSEAGVLTCPVHGWGFDTRTGREVGGGTSSVPVYAVRVADGQVMIRV